MDIGRLLPPSTNDAYRGSPLSVWFLMLASALTIVPGLIHYALRYRSLVPLCLLLLVLQQALGAASGWLWKGASGGHHPPEHYASLVFTVLGLLFLGLSLRSRARPSA
jgi:hypothetical protein